MHLPVAILICGSFLAAPDDAVEQDRLSPAGAQANDFFGAAVCVEGDVAFVGAHEGTFNLGTSGPGFVVRYRRALGRWTEQATIGASDGSNGDWFGYSLDVSGDTLVVGAPQRSPNTSATGAAYVFVDTGSGWVEQAKLTASDGANGDHFGTAVGIDGDTIVVGAGLGPGGAYVFTRSGTSWSETTKLVASGFGSVSSEYGKAVAIDGDTILVGAPGYDNLGYDSGGAFAFVRSGGVWLEQGSLIPADGATLTYHGRSLALEGDRAVLGGLDVFGGGPGNAYVFERAGSSWTEAQKLVPQGAASDANFGQTVALSGNSLLIAAPGYESGSNLAGAVHQFERTQSGWVEGPTIAPSDSAVGDNFGIGLSLDGGTFLVGAPRNDGAGANAGAAYAFVLSSLPFDIQPRRPSLGQSLTATTRNGIPGNPVLIYLTGFNGSPTSIYTSLGGVFDATGTWTISVPLNNSPGPFTVTFQAFALGPPGMRVISSNEIAIDLP